ncbi:MAG: CoA-binding protein [Spirochaetota bacterium]|nr:CoA-binding protein [Spirochaetota bacterium]
MLDRVDREIVEEKVKFQDLDRIFNPKRIAIIGVSSKGAGFGNGSLLAIQALNYPGDIYPVNPRGGSINGMKIYKSLDEIDGELDFAVISVPAKDVPGVIEECLKKNSAGVEILSAGFSETGTQEGIMLEEDIKRVAQKGIRVIGPNCFGIYCPKCGLNIPPGPDFSHESGPVAFLSQSGGMSSDFACLGKWMGINFSKMVSFGNGVDLRETELLEYLAEDSDTEIISMYIEGVRDGRRFFKVLRDVASKKPIIVYKGGLSDAGQRAVASHTASMGGKRKIWESMIKQCNIVQVRSLIEMAETCLAFCLLPRRVYRRVSIIGGGGALGVMASDAADSFGIELPVFKGEIYDNIMSLLPKPGSSAANPIDVANPMVSIEFLKEVMLIAGKDERVDFQVMIQLLHTYKAVADRMGGNVKELTPYEQLASMLWDVAESTGKPAVIVLPRYRQGVEDIDLEEMMRLARQAFYNKGIPVFHDVIDAFRAVKHVSDYYKRHER